MTFRIFTPICAVPGYAGYGECGGDATHFSDVRGHVVATQAHAPEYRLEVSFSGLAPADGYSLWANLNGAFVEIAARNSDREGHIAFAWQATLAAGDLLAFDLRHGSTTIVTSYWSGQPIGPKGPRGPLVVVPSALVRAVAADGAGSTFAIGDGTARPIAFFTGATGPFDSGYLLVPSPRAFEIAAWAGAADLAARCTDGLLPFAPAAAGHYTGPGPTDRSYVYFSADAGHVYTCDFAIPRDPP
jgi:hypothetical protein